MINNELGFVLRRFLPEKQKISVLSKSRGKINLSIASLQNCQKLWPGNLIAYNYTSLYTAKMYQKNGMQKSHNSIEDRIEILYVPSEFTGHRIYWIHHLLEICYYFFPLEQPCFEVFELLSNALRLTVRAELYTYEFMVQKLCIIKLLSYAGFVPPLHFQKFLQLFEIVCSQAVDEAERSKIELTKILLEEDNKDLNDIFDVWILKALKTHPNFNFFKGSKFLHQT